MNNKSYYAKLLWEFRGAALCTSSVLMGIQLMIVPISIPIAALRVLGKISDALGFPHL